MSDIHPFLSKIVTDTGRPGTKKDCSRKNNIWLVRYLQVRQYVLEKTEFKTSRLTKDSLVEGKKHLELLRDAANTEKEKQKYKTLLKAIPSALRARESLITHNMRLVLAVLPSYYCSDEHLLFSFGIQGLMKAVDNYRFGKKSQFSTYATLMIRQQISKGVRDTARLIRLPAPTEGDAVAFLKIKEKIKEYKTTRNIDEPVTDDEIVEHYLKNKSNVKDTPQVRKNIKKRINFVMSRVDTFVRLDALPNNSQAWASKELTISARELLPSDQSLQVMNALNYIPEQFHYAISRLWGVDNLPASYNQVSEETGISIELLEQQERTLASMLQLPLFQ